LRCAKFRPYLLLDAWRGIAALWVVMAHACIAFLATGDNGRYLHWPIYEVSVWGQLGVVIFFVISGFCITGAAQGAFLGRRGIGKYTFDRIRRIYPPYLAALFLGAGVALAMRLAEDHHLIPRPNHSLDFRLWVNPSYVLSNLFLVQPEAGQPALLFVAWSLSYEVAYYVVMGGVLTLTFIAGRRFESLAPAVFLLGGGVLTFVSLGWLLLEPGSCHFPVDRAFQFGLGVLLFLVYALPGGRSAWLARGQLGLALGLTLVLAWRPPEGSAPAMLGQPSLQFQAVTCFLFVLLLLAMRPRDFQLAHAIWLRPLMWLGVISYSLYLVHTLIMFIPDVGLRRLGWDRGWYWVTYLVEIVTAIAAGWIFHMVVERHFISSRQKRRIAEELPA
jgi:exopolysaccharide production protein ExoZ